MPTCPDWTVRRLVAHQGMVHRWAAAAVRGERVEPDAFEHEGLTHERPGRAGCARVPTRWWPRSRRPTRTCATIVFLNDAPAPRRFWARRQCHETTMHAVDALSAALGRRPVAADSWIDPVLARDGIDELLGGFLTRNHSRLALRGADHGAGRADRRRRVVAARGEHAPGGDHAAYVHGGRWRRRRRRGAAGAVGRALPRALEPLRRGGPRPPTSPTLWRCQSSITWAMRPRRPMRSGVGAGR